MGQLIEMLDNSSGEEDGGGKEFDIVNAFNLTTFDINDSLAFGESFGGVSSGLFWKTRSPPNPRAYYGPFGLIKVGDIGKEHFWVSIVISSLGQGALADCFKRFP